jgi:hypothetical protein
MIIDKRVWSAALDLHARSQIEKRRFSRYLLIDEMGISEHLARFLETAIRNLAVISGSEMQVQTRVQRQLSHLRTELGRSQSEVKRLTGLADLASSLKAHSLEPPQWLQPPRTNDDRCVVSTALGDVHADEVVKPAEINYVNEYNRDIATSRIKKYFDSCIRLGRDYFSGMRFDGLVVNLLGDMVSGLIHEELAATNEYPISETIFYYAELIAAGILLLAEFYGPTLVVCVVGNHGRLKPDITYKGVVQDNFDYMLYQLVALHLKNHRDITFYIPLSPDAFYQVYRTRYCLTHGNQFKGGSGWMGPLGPIMRGDRKKKEKRTKLHLPYDTMVAGHFHTYVPMPDCIMNGSLVGYSEFSNSGNFAPEPPQQALWLTDPRKGPTIHAPVHCRLGSERWPAEEIYDQQASPVVIFDPAFKR